MEERNGGGDVDGEATCGHEHLKGEGKESSSRASESAIREDERPRRQLLLLPLSGAFLSGLISFRPHGGAGNLLEVLLWRRAKALAALWRHWRPRGGSGGLGLGLAASWRRCVDAGDLVEVLAASLGKVAEDLVEALAALTALWRHWRPRGGAGGLLRRWQPGGGASGLSGATGFGGAQRR